MHTHYKYDPSTHGFREHSALDLKGRDMTGTPPLPSLHLCAFPFHKALLQIHHVGDKTANRYFLHY